MAAKKRLEAARNDNFRLFVKDHTPVYKPNNPTLTNACGVCNVLRRGSFCAHQRPLIPDKTL
jgi:hypothetical protein